MKTNNFSKWARTFLGLFLIVYAANHFLHFIPFTYGQMPENTRMFIDAVAEYLPFLYILEILIGLFLIFNKWTAFIYIVLFPLSISFLMFTIINNDLNNMWPAWIVALLNFGLMFNHREKYKALFS